MSYLNRTICMPQDLLLAFSEHTGLFWSSFEIEGAICDAITAAMQPKPVQASAPPIETGDGYQWKQIFLPEGTVLRASFGRQPYYATVQGGAIKYGEFNLSPSAFANLQGSGNRNAWKAVWLRFPGFKDWVRADECRAVRLAITQRMFEPNQPADEPEAKPAMPVGEHQQRYTEKRPMDREMVTYYQMLNEFPEDVAETASDDTPESEPTPALPAACQPAHPGPDLPRQSKKRGQHKTGKRQSARRKKR